MTRVVMSSCPPIMNPRLQPLREPVGWHTGDRQHTVCQQEQQKCYHLVFPTKVSIQCTGTVCCTGRTRWLSWPTVSRRCDKWCSTSCGRRRRRASGTTSCSRSACSVSQASHVCPHSLSLSLPLSLSLSPPPPLHGLVKCSAMIKHCLMVNLLKCKCWSVAVYFAHCVDRLWVVLDLIIMFFSLGVFIWITVERGCWFTLLFSCFPAYQEEYNLLYSGPVFPP